MGKKLTSSDANENSSAVATSSISVILTYEKIQNTRLNIFKTASECEHICHLSQLLVTHQYEPSLRLF